MNETELHALLTPSDRMRLDDLGIDESEVLRQIALFRSPPPFAALERPCTVDDGIVRLDEERQREVLAIAQHAADEGRVSAFVPASGAASRMFKALLSLRNRNHETFDDVHAAADDGGSEEQAYLDLVEAIGRFPFGAEAVSLLAERHGPRSDLRAYSPSQVLAVLFDADGLHLAASPKGLVPFHRYRSETRTALTEHLVEAAGYAVDPDHTVNVHVTVPESHVSEFRAVADAANRELGETYGATWNVAFSCQRSDTDTVAVTPEDELFRCDDGTLLVRPGGHGSLIYNLGGCGGDVVAIKNIDNILPDGGKPLTIRWRKLLIGVLVDVQGRAHAILDAIDEGRCSPRDLDDALDFVETTLCSAVSNDLRRGDPDTKKAFLRERLDRPFRVCGVVPEQGEPGGGPFWIKDGSGSCSIQIVESSQIDPYHEAQQAVFGSSTHFNPVDIVAGLRDHRGDPIDLAPFVDPSTVFISSKSFEGRPLKALEHPGLWNGAMTHWNTIFVETPGETFAPVKTVFDLLRGEHQAEKDR